VRPLLTCLVALPLALACTFSLHAQEPEGGPAAVDPPDTEYANGDVAIDPEILRTLPVVPRYRAFLPVTVNLASRMPPVGDQKKLNSCTAWAAAYAARSYYTRTLERRDVRENVNQPSPNYVFHLARQKDCAAGSSIYHVVEVLKNGALSLQDYPYDVTCVPAAPPELVSKAQDFRVRGMRLVDPKRTDDIKGQLARSHPVVISFNDSAAFHKFRKTREVFTEVTPEESKGWHAVTLVGYDDERQAFLVMNSWGRGWGSDGYGWVAYDVIRERTRQAAVLDVVPSTRPPPMISLPVPPPSPPPPVISAPATPPATPPPLAKLAPAVAAPPASPPLLSKLAPAAPSPAPSPPLLSKLAPVAKEAPVRGLVAPGVEAKHIPAIRGIEPDGPVAEPAPISNPAADTATARRPAEIEDLQGLSCAKIAVQTVGERKSLAGFVASAADLELVKRVAAEVPGTLLGEVAVAPWPQCEVLLTLDTPLAGADRPTISIDSPGALREGERLRLAVRSPAQTSYVYVFYVQVDGSVVTLAQPPGVAPEPTPPGSNIAFGDGPNGFTIGRPFGREMIVALASRRPLFEQGLLARQTEREFLSTLRRELIYKPSPGMPDREVTAAVAILETRAR
jgi:Papain family cysteine protease/Domain of unknown function (DUF4384)